MASRYCITSTTPHQKHHTKLRKTGFTIVKVLTSMDSNVFLQVLGKTETLVTVMTTEWSLIGVDHLMPMKIFKKGEATATSFTLVGTGFIS